MSALKGLRIVDFSRFLPGAYASWVAADLGADVIRIEHPRELAKQRAMFGTDEDERSARRRRARLSFTRNKRSLMINPGNLAARKIIHRLIEQADVLIEDYRPGVMASMGYGYEEMAALNPRLIYCSASFAGQTGPLAGKPGHDPAALALSGALSRLNGLAEPSMPGLQVADVVTGAHTSIAMLAALQARERTGRGQHADIAMTDASMALLVILMGRNDDLSNLPPALPWHPKGGVWKCADGGYICTTDMEPSYWRRFCEAVGRPDFIPLQNDLAAHPSMKAELEALFATRTRDEWADFLGKTGTQAMPVLSVTEALNHPHNRARGMVHDVPLDGDRPVRQLGLPFRLSDTPALPPRPSGLPGEESDEILRELGLGDEDRMALERAGAFDDSGKDAG